MGKKVIYAIYKGDVFVDLGTKEELAERMNVKPQSVEHLVRPSYKKRMAKIQKENTGHLIAIRIGKVGDKLDESRDSTKATKL